MAMLEKLVFDEVYTAMRLLENPTVAVHAPDLYRKAAAIVGASFVAQHAELCFCDVCRLGRSGK